jgi:hypothetical protein
LRATAIVIYAKPNVIVEINFVGDQFRNETALAPSSLPADGHNFACPAGSRSHTVLLHTFVHSPFFFL